MLPKLLKKSIKKIYLSIYNRIYSKYKRLYYQPSAYKKYNIYDIFYNDNQQIVIIANAIEPLECKIYDENKNILKFQLNINLKMNIFYCKVQNYQSKARLIINNHTIDVNVNKYPSFSEEIIMSTLVKHMDERVLQWINYHQFLGVTRFIIYDNSNDCRLGKVLKDLIHKKIVFLIKWNFQYMHKNFRDAPLAQLGQLNHSIYAFQKAKYIGLMDVDEYCNPQKHLSLENLFSEVISKNKLKVENIGGFKVVSKFFFNPLNKPVNGYRFLKIYDCTRVIQEARQKMFVIPQNIKICHIHHIEGKKLYKLQPSLFYFNHYSFLSGKRRLARYPELLETDKSIRKITSLMALEMKGYTITIEMRMLKYIKNKICNLLLKK